MLPAVVERAANEDWKGDLPPELAPPTDEEQIQTQARELEEKDRQLERMEDEHARIMDDERATTSQLVSEMAEENERLKKVKRFTGRQHAKTVPALRTDVKHGGGMKALMRTCVVDERDLVGVAMALTLKERGVPIEAMARAADAGTSRKSGDDDSATPTGRGAASLESVPAPVFLFFTSKRCKPRSPVGSRATT